MDKKYIDAEKLIAEIERRVEEYNIQSLRGAELSDLLSFITSLQQEQPEVELEEEIERIIKNEDRFMKFQVKEQLIKYVARHFAEWGAIHLNARKED